MQSVQQKHKFACGTKIESVYSPLKGFVASLFWFFAEAREGEGGSIFMIPVGCERDDEIAVI